MAVLSTAITTALTTVLGEATVAFLSTGLGRFVTSLGTTLLLGAVQGSPTRTGITSQFASVGADTALRFTMGPFATTGTRFHPWLSHGKDGKTPRAFLTLPVVVFAAPGVALTDRIAINGEWVDLGLSAHPEYGTDLSGKYFNNVWVKYYNGSQTAADPMMLDKYGSDPDYPWTADMIGTGLCVAYVTFRNDPELFNGLPTVVFEAKGIPLYDPRKDSSVGGDGLHRWDNKTHWQPTGNLAVQAYNVARGVELFTGDIWGGGFDGDALPLDNWIAAMNACDIDVDGQPAFHGGIEVSVDEKPSDVMLDLAKGCGGKYAEVAGSLKMQVGGVGLPVMFITDADFLVNKERTETPFTSATKTFNGVKTTYPEPESIYAPEDAPLLNSAAFEAEDNGRRSVADLQLRVVPDSVRAQYLADMMLKDNRRFGRHSGSQQGAAPLLEPLDAISWTSVDYGYVGKTFELLETIEDPRDCVVNLSLLERDAADWTPVAGVLKPTQPRRRTTSTPPEIEVESLDAVEYSQGIAGRLALAERGVVGAGFEGGVNGQAGAPNGWELNFANAGALTRCGYHTLQVDPLSIYGSQVAYGCLVTGVGGWWSLSRFFEVQGGQTVNVSLAVRLAFPSDVAQSLGQNPNFVDEDDLLIALTFYNARGGSLGVFAPRGASSRYWELNGVRPMPLQWFRFDHPGITAPADATSFKIDLIAADGNATVVSARLDYMTWASGNALVMLDDVIFDVDGEPALPLSRRAFDIQQGLGQTVHWRETQSGGQTLLEPVPFDNIAGPAIPDLVYVDTQNIAVNSVSDEGIFGSDAVLTGQSAITNADGYVNITATAQAYSTQGIKAGFSLSVEFTVSGMFVGPAIFSIRVGRKFYTVAVPGPGTYEFDFPRRKIDTSGPGLVSLSIDANGSTLPAGASVTFVRAFHRILNFKR